MKQSDLGQGREFDVVRQISAALGPVVDGLGNDCALLPCGSGFLAVSTDTSVEGGHFRRDWLSLTEIGWRATAAALSDLAAAGAVRPRILAAVTTPDADEAVEVMRGVGEAAVASGGLVVGGDLTRGDTLSLTITVLGTSATAMSRAGARPGDAIWVTGHLGLARAALWSWQHSTLVPDAARIRFAHPEPRIAAGAWLAGHGATAMIDISDGLAGDAGHLAAASRCRIELEVDRLPIAAAVADTAQRAGVSPAIFAALGGEDYELLAVMPAEFDGGQFTRDTGVALTRIGHCRAAAGARPRVIVTLGGQQVELSGFDHF